MSQTDHPYRDPEWLKREYEDRTLAEIADEVGVHVSTISKWKQIHEIEKSDQVQLVCPVCEKEFTRYQYEVDRTEYTNFCSRECLYQGRRRGMLDWRNRIIQGDARDMEQLPDRSVDLIVASPPYNVGLDYEGFNDDQDEYGRFLFDVFSECHRVLRKDGGRLVVVIGGSSQGEVPSNHLALDRAQEAGFEIRREIIWDKQTSAGRTPYFGSYASASCPAIFQRHETILILYKGSFKRPDSGADTIEKREFLEGTDSVWEIPADSTVGDSHPAPFPVELPRRAIELFSYEEDSVAWTANCITCGSKTLIAIWDHIVNVVGYVRVART